MKNKIELLGIYGSDEVIACSAWTSTSRDLSDDKRKRIEGLVKQLWSQGHETPFEKGIVHFLVDTDIASHIHILKHRISSANAESARYKELKEDKYYLPEDWEGIAVSSDFDLDLYSYQGVPWLGDNWKDVLKNYTELGNKLYHQCLKDLEPVLGRKRAKESARYFKGYNSQIQADVMFNMRSFANFLHLRNSEHAQLEIRQIAQEMYNLVEATGQFKHTLNSWKKPKIVCLCGSTKFKNEFEELNKKLTLEGKIVLSVGFFLHSTPEAISEESKIELDLLHKKKIDMADEIYVINKDGYIGLSTQSEIAYATRLGKKITYLYGE